MNMLRININESETSRVVRHGTPGTVIAVSDFFMENGQMEIPYGYCHCGCGKPAHLAKQTDSRRGWINGEPIRFIYNHHGKVIKGNWKGGNRIDSKGYQSIRMELTVEVFQEYLAEANSVHERVVSDLVIAADAAAKREKEDAERKAESERLEAIRKQQAEESARIEALRKAEEDKARKEREALDAERRKIDAEKAAIEAQKKAEAERIARELWEKKKAEEFKARAEKEAAEKIEREARESKEREERENAEKARAEALRPDKEKLIDWFFKVENVPKPDLSSEEAKAILANAIRGIDRAFNAAKKEMREMK